MNRRNLLKSLVAGTIATSLPLGSFASQGPTKRFPWKNWSGNQTCLPEQRLAPGSVAEIQSLIRDTKGKIRTVGSGHSFSELVPTDHTLLSVRRLSGPQKYDADKLQATFGAGSLLSEIGPELAQHDQALVNMPDIDQQTLAGAIATSTHGTGKQLHSLSAYVAGLEFVSASGDLIYCDEDTYPEIFKAAQVSLGALGIVTAVTMQNREPFKLKREASWIPFEEICEQAHALSDTNRNFEFFYFPFTGMSLIDTLNETSEDITHGEEIDGNSGLLDLKHARDYLSWSNKLRQLILGSYMKNIDPSANIDHSYAIYASERNVRFNEMEYHLPAENGIQALKEIRTLIESRFPEVFFPIECRFIKADDIWLSPFYGRDTMSIAVHRYFEEDYLPLFRAIEPIFKKYNGRPHWGKWNDMSPQEFPDQYANWQAFLAVRNTLDPEGRFLNKYLSRTFQYM